MTKEKRNFLIAGTCVLAIIALISFIDIQTLRNRSKRFRTSMLVSESKSQEPASFLNEIMSKLVQLEDTLKSLPGFLNKKFSGKSTESGSDENKKNEKSKLVIEDNHKGSDDNNGKDAAKANADNARNEDDKKRSESLKKQMNLDNDEHGAHSKTEDHPDKEVGKHEDEDLAKNLSSNSNKDKQQDEKIINNTNEKKNEKKEEDLTKNTNSDNRKDEIEFTSPNEKGDNDNKEKIVQNKNTERSEKNGKENQDKTQSAGLNNSDEDKKENNISKKNEKSDEKEKHSSPNITILNETKPEIYSSFMKPYNIPNNQLESLNALERILSHSQILPSSIPFYQEQQLRNKDMTNSSSYNYPTLQQAQYEFPFFSNAPSNLSFVPHNHGQSFNNLSAFKNFKDDNKSKPQSEFKGNTTQNTNVIIMPPSNKKDDDSTKNSLVAKSKNPGDFNNEKREESERFDNNSKIHPEENKSLSNAFLNLTNDKNNGEVNHKGTNSDQKDADKESISKKEKADNSKGYKDSVNDNKKDDLADDSINTSKPDVKVSIFLPAVINDDKEKEKPFAQSSDKKKEETPIIVIPISPETPKTGNLMQDFSNQENSLISKNLPQTQDDSIHNLQNEIDKNILSLFTGTMKEKLQPKVKNKSQIMILPMQSEKSDKKENETSPNKSQMMFVPIDADNNKEELDLQENMLNNALEGLNFFANINNNKINKKPETNTKKYVVVSRMTKVTTVPFAKINEFEDNKDHEKKIKEKNDKDHEKVKRIKKAKKSVKEKAKRKQAERKHDTNEKHDEEQTQGFDSKEDEISDQFTDSGDEVTEKQNKKSEEDITNESENENDGGSYTKTSKKHVKKSKSKKASGKKKAEGKKNNKHSDSTYNVDNNLEQKDSKSDDSKDDKKGKNNKLFDEYESVMPNNSYDNMEHNSLGVDVLKNDEDMPKKVEDASSKANDVPKKDENAIKKDEVTATDALNSFGKYLSDSNINNKNTQNVFTDPLSEIISPSSLDLSDKKEQNNIHRDLFSEIETLKTDSKTKDEEDKINKNIMDLNDDKSHDADNLIANLSNTSNRIETDVISKLDEMKKPENNKKIKDNDSAFLENIQNSEIFPKSDTNVSNVNFDDKKLNLLGNIDSIQPAKDEKDDDSNRMKFPHSNPTNLNNKEDKSNNEKSSRVTIDPFFESFNNNSNMENEILDQNSSSLLNTNKNELLNQEYLNPGEIGTVKSNVVNDIKELGVNEIS